MRPLRGLQETRVAAAGSLPSQLRDQRLLRRESAPPQPRDHSLSASLSESFIRLISTCPLRSDVSSHPHQTVLLTAADWFSGEVMYFCNPTPTREDAAPHFENSPPPQLQRSPPLCRLNEETEAYELKQLVTQLTDGRARTPAGFSDSEARTVSAASRCLS